MRNQMKKLAVLAIVMMLLVNLIIPGALAGGLSQEQKQLLEQFLNTTSAGSEGKAGDGVPEFPLDITLETVLTERTDESATYELIVNCYAPEGVDIVKNIYLSLQVPEEFKVDGVLSGSIGDIDSVGDSFGWYAMVPVPEENTNYTWSVVAESDSFANGVSVSMQDTFQVVGQGATDYTWIFGKDNFCFTNSDSYFGQGTTYYIDDEDFEAFVSQLNNTEITQLTNWYAVDQDLNHFLNNELKNWNGSCFGLSLTAALYKVGLLNPADYTNASGAKAVSTYDIQPIKPNVDTPFESMVNIYHITAGTDVALNNLKIKVSGSKTFPDVAREMWNKALHIGAEGSVEQPYVVYLASSSGGAHAIVCYGAEEGNWNANGGQYTKRLLIADPNKTEDTFIYISDDFMNAFYSGNKVYDIFGCYNVSLSDLNKRDYYDTAQNYQIKLSADEDTNLTLTTDSAKAVIIDGQMLVLKGDLPYSKYEPFNMVEGKNDSDGGNCVYLFECEDNLTVTPMRSDKEMNALIVRGDYSVNLTGSSDGMILTPSGDVRVTGATGNISLQMAVNDSEFDFVTIDGRATGDVQVSIQNNELDVSGALQSYSVENLTADKKTLYFEAEATDRARFVVDRHKLSAYTDQDGDGDFETALKNIAK